LQELFSMLFALAAVIALILGAGWAVKRFAPARVTPSGRNIRVLERAALAQDKTLVLVEAGGRVYLLGVAGQQIVRIGRFTPDCFEAPLSPCEKPGGFEGLLAAAASRLHQGGDKKDGGQPGQ
jgi:flagellar biosynthetic protein FliO